MPAGSQSKPVGTLSLAGSYVPSGEKKRALDEVFAGRNVRSTLDGGRIDRPGYLDTEIDLSSFNFTKARGLFGASDLKRLWLAGDNDTNVKILYANPVDETVYDTGITLTTGHNVWFEEVEMDIYYGNGTNTMGRIVVGEVGTGGVLAGATSLTLKAGHSVRFPATGSGRIGNDTFAWTGNSGGNLTGVTGVSENHDAGEVVTLATTLSPTHVTAPKVIREWFATLNIGGDPSKPRVWEFSRSATAANPERYYDFSVATNNELVGKGSGITAMLPTNEYFWLFKEDSIYATARVAVNAQSGARSPLEFSPGYGVPNPWCVAPMEGIVAFLTTNKRLMPIQIVTDQNGSSLKISADFDRRIRSYLRTIDDDLSDAWVFFNPEDQLLKVGVKREGVREILVYDAQLGIFYPPDTNKDFDFMATLDRKSYGYSSDGQKLYLDEVGTFDDTVPVDSDWETGRFGGEFTRSAFRYLYVHGRMTEGSRKYVAISINGEEKYVKELTDRFLVTGASAKPVGYGGIGVAGISVANPGLVAKEFQMPIGTFKHGQDIKVRVYGSSEEGGDFVQVDGYTFGVTPRSKYPGTHV